MISKIFEHDPGRSRQPMPPLGELVRLITGQSISSTIPAGLTYLGQMVAHELVSATRLHNVKTVPFFNMDSLYGKDDTLYHFLFDSRNGKFYLNNAEGELTSGEDGIDLPRSKCGNALIPDRRNNENAIIAQLHVFWMKLHNHIRDELGDKDYLNPRQKIDDARKYLSWIFQIIVLEDYIKPLFDETVVEHYFAIKRPLLFNKRDANEAPDLFKLALFRFGHSMVRNSYTLSEGNSTFLSAILFQGGEQSDGIISDDLRINNWRLFFRVDDEFDHETFPNPASDIDLSIAGRMENFGGEHQSRAIAHINLNEHFSNGLLPAEEVFDILLSDHADLARNVEIHPESFVSWPPFLNDSNNRPAKQPLWFYILNEARQTQNGKRLGKLGSLLVLDILMNAMLHSDQPIMREYLSSNNKSDFLNNRFGKLFTFTDDSPLNMAYLIKLAETKA